MRWKSAVNSHDLPSLAPDTRLKVAAASGEALAASTLTDDVQAEQQKLFESRCPDPLVSALVVFHARGPERLGRSGLCLRLRLWREHSEAHWGDQYGEGTFAGKHAMLIVTTDGGEERYSAGGHQRADRRSAVPDRLRYSLLSGLRRASTVRGLQGRSPRRGRLRAGRRAIARTDSVDLHLALPN
jgi:hypothetical protein